VRALWHVLFPESCIACGRVEAALRSFCAECALSVEPLPSGGCHRCAEPGRFAGGACPRCARRPPPFVVAHAPFVHTGAIARAIHAFKYEDHPERAASLAGLWLRESAPFLSRAPQEVLAIPLHRARFRQRQYDQAQLLARALAGHTKRRLCTGLLERARDTARQVDLSEAEREANVGGAFSASARARGRSFILVDDVFTTGATARAAAQALMCAGALRVEILTLARAWSGG